MIRTIAYASYSRFFASCLVVLLANPLAISAYAQTAPAPNEASVQTPTVCFTGTQKIGSDKGRSFAIRVASDKAETFRNRGLSQTACTGTFVQSEAERKRMCALASTGNRAITLMYWLRFSVTPLEVCRGVTVNPSN